MINLNDLLALAYSHACRKGNDSALLCYSDGASRYAMGDHTAARRRLLDSLKHSVGILHDGLRRAREAQEHRDAQRLAIPTLAEIRARVVMPPAYVKALESVDAFVTANRVALTNYYEDLREVGAAIGEPMDADFKTFAAIQYDSCRLDERMRDEHEPARPRWSAYDEGQHESP